MKRSNQDFFTKWVVKQASRFKKMKEIELESMFNSYGGLVDEYGRWKKNLGQTKRQSHET